MNEINQATVKQLKENQIGSIISPNDKEFNDIRSLWNGMIDKKPALIFRCQNEEDVAAAIHFSKENDLEVAIRGGGHNVAGLACSDGGIVIDLTEMNSVRVNAKEHRVYAGGGATICDLDRETQKFGLATPMGVVSATGIAGLTLSGGIGWLRNKYGLSSDNLIAAEVVTADGKLVHTSETENSELLWGLRGGGGNFGVVTTFVYRLHEVGPEVMSALVFYPGDSRKEVLHDYREFTDQAPDEVSSIAINGFIPDEPAYPEEIHGEPFIALVAMYSGDPEKGKEILQPLREFSKPMLDLSDVMSYTDVQQLFDEDYPDGRRYYWKSIYLNSLDDEVIDKINEQTEKAPSNLSTVDVWPLGGAMRRVESEETAFGARHAPYLLGIEANWTDPGKDEDNIRWARSCLNVMKSFGGGTYLNFPGFFEEEDTKLPDIYGKNYQRLVDLKTQYDPENLFRLNQNIEPKGK